MKSEDGLERFKVAHARGGIDGGSSYDIAISELREGSKQSHWMWYVFPQVIAGSSTNAQKYRIRSLVEAESYVADELLWTRYVECVMAVEQGMKRIAERRGRPGMFVDVLGSGIDEKKFVSSVTLFHEVTRSDNTDRVRPFRELMGDGLPGRFDVSPSVRACERTLEIVRRWRAEAD